MITNNFSEIPVLDCIEIHLNINIYRFIDDKLTQLEFIWKLTFIDMKQEQF